MELCMVDKWPWTSKVRRSFLTTLTERSTRTADIGQVINTNTLNLTCLDRKRYRLERGLRLAIHYRQGALIQLHRKFSLFVLRRSVQDKKQRRLREIDLGVVSKGFFLRKIRQGLHLRISNEHCWTTCWWMSKSPSFGSVEELLVYQPRTSMPSNVL